MTETLFHYRIRLRPLTPYFFGQERTFGPADTVQNYLVRSAHWPQQTTLLGTLRYHILQQKKLLPIHNHTSAAREAIGPQSFVAGEGKNNFGIIDSISPLFFLKGDEMLVWENRGTDVKYQKHQPKSNDEPRPTDQAFRIKSDGVNVLAAEMPVPLLEGYDPKKHYPEYLIKVGVPTDKIKLDDILTEYSQIGIRKRQRGEGKEAQKEGFYKQFFYEMKPGYAFGFLAGMTEKLDEGTFTVFMGGEKSVFEMTIEASHQNQTYAQLLNLDADHSGKRIALLSDAYVTPELYDTCEFAMLATVPFRSLCYSIAADTKYIGLPNKNTQLHHLARRGSVLYVRDLATAKKSLFAPDFYQIGYNHYQILD